MLGVYRYSFCEIFARKILPSIKLYIAAKLVSDYGFTQLEASRLLGVKQPLINYVLTGRRKPKYIELVERIPEVEAVVREFIDEIASRGRRASSSGFICRLCRVFRDGELLDRVLGALGYSVDEVYIPEKP